jgi:hypothetical protein
MAAHRTARRRVNPALLAAVLASGIPGWKIAAAVGLVHHSRFSDLINNPSIPATPVNLDRMRRIAEIVGFPPAQLFLFDEEAER